MSKLKKIAQIYFLLKKRKLDENHKGEVKSTGTDGIKRYEQSLGDFDIFVCLFLFFI